MVGKMFTFEAIEGKCVFCGLGFPQRLTKSSAGCQIKRFEIGLTRELDKWLWVYYWQALKNSITAAMCHVQASMYIYRRFKYTSW